MAKKTKTEEVIEYTGRYLVVLPEGASTADAISEMSSVGGLNLQSSLDYENELFTAQDIEKSDGIILDKIGIAILNEKPQIDISVAAFGDSQVVVERERVVYALNGPLDESVHKYIQGYRDAIIQMSEMLIGTDSDEESSLDSEDFGADVQSVGATWGLKATNVVPTTVGLSCPYSGSGIRVAILDTGFDFNHPDFAGRSIMRQSFIAGEAVQDGHGHGTHCTGTSCGPLNSITAAQRYGIAYGANIYIGKVLSNLGKGPDGSILAGINWAIANGCQVISMSLGAKSTTAGYSAAYETAAARGLQLGSLIVAAAGNDSSRPGSIIQVSHPANCPSIMAVGAVDINMKVAGFSNGGLYPTYGAVDIVGPGVGVYSSTKLPAKYATWNGTSMATPHVAGIAALYAQSAGVRGINLWRKLTATAKPLNLPARDVGAGLVQAPTMRTFVIPRPGPILIPKPFPKIPIPVPYPFPKPFPIPPTPPQPFGTAEASSKGNTEMDQPTFTAGGASPLKK